MSGTDDGVDAQGNAVKPWLLALSLLAASAPVTAAVGLDADTQAVRLWRQQHEQAIVDEYVGFLRIPDVSSDAANIRRNAGFIAAMMRARGIDSKLVTVGDANPVVFGEIRTPGATRTLVFYAHYDGQPLDPKEWTTPPFEPTLRSQSIENGGRVLPLAAPGGHFDPESRLYARAAGDDKVSIMALMAAVDALRASGLKTRSNIKFAFEGEEEAGSAHLRQIISANKELFAGDLWLMCDGPVHQTRRQLIYFGARDVDRLDLTVYGPAHELHSGHYGNWAPNPAMELARLLASMKDDGGHVLVEHFYDGIEPLTALEQRAVAESPDIDDALREEFWLGSSEGAPRKLAELITQPSLNIRGMASARVGAQASNVIPATATASIDIRLVKGMDPQRTLDRVIEHIRAQGFFVVDKEPTAELRRAHPKVLWAQQTSVGESAIRTSMDLPISQEVIGIVERVRGPTVKLPNMGGSLPLAAVVGPLHTTTIVIPIANHDDRQHSFDENLRLQNLWDGIELMAALLQM
jgi:acetylornithine deacetylase/succinyl-diaminopimelate desuccinylase-like protein